MKTKSFYAKRIHPLVFMALVTIVCIVLTAALHLYTLELVEENEQFFLWRSILDAAAITHDGTPSNVVQIFNEFVTDEGDRYVINTDDGIKRYVFASDGPGLWGTISVMIGFEEDLNTFSGVSIVSQTETPGLGARIEEPWFTAQFAGKQGPFRVVEEGTASSDDEMDGITGATRTSESFRNIMNRLLESDKVGRGQ
ncbi:MAG: FMN-binding protein [Sphaerochaetaceae bacterium]|jgi:Na+-transporting NADH:ubiquinone oxidoreductase subunit C